MFKDSEAKTSAVVASVVIKECSDAKQDESGEAEMKNCTDYTKFAADADNNGRRNRKIHDVSSFTDIVVGVDRLQLKIMLFIKEFGYDNIDVNTNDVVADEDVDLAEIIFARWKLISPKSLVTEVLAVKDDAFMVDKKYVNASALNLSSDENVIISDRDVLEKEVDDVPDVENVVSEGNKPLVMLESGKIAFNGSHAKSVDVVAGNKDVNGSESKANDVDFVVKDKIFGSGEDVDSNVKKVDIKDDDGNVVVSDEKLFNGDEDVEISQQNYVVTADKMLVSDEAGESEPKNMNGLLVVSGSGPAVTSNWAACYTLNPLVLPHIPPEGSSEAKRSDTGNVDMVLVSDENMSVSDDGVKADFVVVQNVKLMSKEIQLSKNEMIEVVSVKETIIISNDDEVPVFGSSEKKAVSDYTFSSDDDDVQIVCVKNSNGKCCHDDPFFDGMPRMKRSKNHHRSPIALQFVLDEASEDEEE
ncbi:hypothetical protein Tco_0842158 [Tanacetum coccineum]|uniref:Uncharacterized protein n=1 Tax=Tanacetum coccineum TaxID=301880 RepID=A0ABQ5B2N8_9ASTR